MRKTIVITGASSGMGRAAALLFAKRGDDVVVAARSREALDDLVARCEALGGRALAVPLDVTDEHAVEELAAAAVGTYGQIDAWVNTAAVQSFGKFWDVPVRSMRRVVDVILVGSMIVSKVAMSRFREQGYGTLVLVSSILSKTPSPYLNVYNAAKHGVAGLATSLRVDLKMEALHERIRVVNLMPPSTDTPFYVHAANYVGQVAKPPPPAYDVETLAEAIVDAVDYPQDEIAVGVAAKVMRASHAFAPHAYESIAARLTSGMFTDEPERISDGNLFEPMAGTAERDGGWKDGHPLKKEELSP